MKQSSLKSILIVFRDPKRGGTSVEEIYHGLILELKKSFDIKVYLYNDQKSILFNIQRINQQHSGVVHITSDMYFLTPFIKGRKILTIHDIEYYKLLRGFKGFIYRWFWLKFPIRLADRIVVVSSYTENELLKYFRYDILNKILIIYNPVPSIYSYKPRKRHNGPPVILQVGTLSNKNLEVVSKALVNIECEFRIIGVLSSEQRALLGSCNIRYYNYYNLSYNEVYQHYVNSDIVIFISSFEGFGMPIIEANAVGRPLICSNRTSLPEVACEAALYVENEKDENEVREKIVFLLGDQQMKDDLVRKGLENIKRFDLAKIVNQYRELYDTYV